MTREPNRRRPEGKDGEKMAGAGCERTRKAIFELLEGTLTEQEEEETRSHLESCDECSQRYRELAETVALLAEVEVQELPPALEEQIADRLSEVEEPESFAATEPRPAVRSAAETARDGERLEPAGGWLERVGLVLAGAAATVLIGLGVWALSQRQNAVDELQPRGEEPAAMARARKGVSQLGVIDRSRVAVLTLTVHSDRDIEEATIRVVLPEGLAFAGPKAVFPERMMMWSHRLRSGSNHIRLPIRALRTGRWELTARVEGADFDEMIRGSVEIRSLGVAGIENHLLPKWQTDEEEVREASDV